MIPLSNCPLFGFSLTTISREYGALMAFPYYDLFMDILKSKISLAPEMSPIEIQRAMKVHHVNEPQATAILGSLRTEGFSLIQGYTPVLPLFTSS